MHLTTQTKYVVLFDNVTRIMNSGRFTAFFTDHTSAEIKLINLDAYTSN